MLDILVNCLQLGPRLTKGSKGGRGISLTNFGVGRSLGITRDNSFLIAEEVSALSGVVGENLLWLVLVEGEEQVELVVLDSFELMNKFLAKILFKRSLDTWGAWIE